MFATCRRAVNTTAAAAAVDVSSCHGAARQRANARIAITMDAALLASIFVALSVPVLVLVLVISVVLVRIILGLALPSRTICHNAMSQT